MTGTYVTVEGIGGSGKTTAMTLLAEWLLGQGIDIVLAKEPAGTEFGRAIRSLVIGQEGLGPLTEAFLFEADRSQNFATLVLPSLNEGKLVLSDRGPDGTMVHQGVLGGVSPPLIQAMTEASTRGRKPDLTILIDVPAEVAYERTIGRPDKDKFDERGLETFQRLRAAYLQLAAAEPERIRIVNGSRAAEEVQTEMRALVALAAGLES